MNFEVSNDWLTERSDALRFSAPESVAVTDVETALSIARELQLLGNDYRYLALTVPPAEIRHRLRVVGRFIYEVAWRIVDGEKLPRDWGTALADKPDLLRQAEQQIQLLEQLDHAARILPWREYAPRALGAIRSKGLAASKKNDQQGFLDAWSFHFEAEEMYKDFREALFMATDPGIRDFAFELDSVQQQLLLAQTGTSCRQAERAFALDEESGSVDAQAAQRVFEYLFSALEDGAFSGREAIRVLEHVEHGYGLVTKANNTHLLGPQNFRNAGCMAARANLLLLPMATAMDRWSRPKPVGYDSWDAYRGEIEQQIVVACRAIERERTQALRLDHLRQIAFIRLSLAFLAPRLRIRTSLQLVDSSDGLTWKFSGQETPLVLDDEACGRLSSWLATDQSDKGDDIIIGSVNMPAYFEALHIHMTQAKTWDRYVQWRTDWPQLDRHQSHARRDAFLAIVDATGHSAHERGQ